MSNGILDPSSNQHESPHNALQHTATANADQAHTEFQFDEPQLTELDYQDDPYFRDLLNFFGQR